MADEIIKIPLHWGKKKNRGALLQVISRTGKIVQEDINRVNRAFFPLLCDSTKLTKHGKGLSIPRLEYDTEDDFRHRVATAGYFLDERGTRGQIYTVLENSIPGRYDLFEMPRDSFRVGFSKIGQARIGRGFILAVKIREMTEEEGEKIYALLDQLLDPDIEIIIIPWISGDTSNLTLSQIRLYGGSNWLRSQFSHICDTEVYLLPDDAFIVGSGRMGISMVFDNSLEDTIIITAPEEKMADVMDQANLIFDNSINWEVRSE